MSLHDHFKSKSVAVKDFLSFIREGNWQKLSHQKVGCIVDESGKSLAKISFYLQDRQQFIGPLSGQECEHSFLGSRTEELFQGMLENNQYVFLRHKGKVILAVESSLYHAPQMIRPLHEMHRGYAPCPVGLD